jgi:cyclopropane fatty-acyl-phospholipid synthase-like methyltransferase
MTTNQNPDAHGYDGIYALFDSPVMQQMRREVYGEDIGQHSWVAAEDLRSDIKRLSLTDSSRLLDLGCGPGGPLVFAVEATGCIGLGLDVSEAALSLARARASDHSIQQKASFQKADLNTKLPCDDRSYDAVMSFDVMLHLRDRKSVFAEAARVLTPGGKFLFTDAGVISGAISNQEIEHRGSHGYTQFVPPGLNEELLRAAGFKVIAHEDRTAGAERIARGRLAALCAHKSEFEALAGKEAFERRRLYLDTMIAISERRALTREMYLAEL